MKKTLFIILILSVTFIHFSYGQKNDSITLKSTFGGYQVFQGEKQLNMTQLSALLESNKVAFNKLKSAQSTNVIASILGGVGGFMIGYPIGTAMAGGNPNWKMAGIGAGLAVISIPISISANNNIKNAVKIYNGSLRTSSFFEKSGLKLAVIENGVGIVINF